VQAKRLDTGDWRDTHPCLATRRGRSLKNCGSPGPPFRLPIHGRGACLTPRSRLVSDHQAGPFGEFGEHTMGGREIVLVQALVKVPGALPDSVAKATEQF
jgi:hypothetical protein